MALETLINSGSQRQGSALIHNGLTQVYDVFDTPEGFLSALIHNGLTRLLLIIFNAVAIGSALIHNGLTRFPQEQHQYQYWYRLHLSIMD